MHAQREARSGGSWILREATGAEDAGELTRLVLTVLMY